MLGAAAFAVAVSVLSTVVAHAGPQPGTMQRGRGPGVPGASGGAAPPASNPPGPAAMTVIFRDDFDGAANTRPAQDKWLFDIGTSYPGGPANWGTGEIQTYTDSTANVALDGAGRLRITPLRDAAGAWTSARIESRQANFKPAEGAVLRVEGRLQLPEVTGPAALGYWPAFWMLGAPYRGNFQNWPTVGEFDVMENVNGANSVTGTVHCGVAPGGPCDENTGIAASRACCQTGFHTYRFEWDRGVSPEQLRWYIDGQQFHTVAETRVDAATWQAATSHEGYFLLLNVAMGGAFPNGVAGVTTPTPATQPGKSMLVDYVTVSTGANPG